ncbi:hypothetical protein [Pseudomonas mangiferae]|uniref:Uncharacterized protein n=1 Tax=Pseudomonas mangiferae TaxID=2593654 RepID=A0A553GUT4_9PSED|nr:hypothetical protein [Pseudomonas mangiferae]TRX73278.1 hypothetical protein FM069_18345 [Pseudomonas mangiferae]
MDTVIALVGAMLFTLLATLVLAPSEEVAQHHAHQLLQQARANVAPLNVRHASLATRHTQVSDVDVQAWQDKRNERFVF